MELKNNQGVAFANKKTKDSQPDFKGEINIEGKNIQIAIWNRTAKSGNKYLSIVVDTKEFSPKKEETQSNSVVLDDDIPWD